MTADDFHGTSAPAVIDRRYSKGLRDSAPQPARLPLQLNSCAEIVPSPIPRAGRRSKGLRGCKRRVWPDGRHGQLPGDIEHDPLAGRKSVDGGRANAVILF